MLDTGQSSEVHHFIHFASVLPAGGMIAHQGFKLKMAHPTNVSIVNVYRVLDFHRFYRFFVDFGSFLISL
jgi:hypothetical protein